MLIVAHADAMHQRTSMHLQRVHLSSHRKLRTTLDITQLKLYTSRSDSTRIDVPAVYGHRRTNKKSHFHHLLPSHSLIVVAAAAATVCPKFARALIGQVYESGRQPE
jgi:hypothetical protein